MLETKILGIKVDFLSMAEALKWAESQVKYNKRGQITTPNPEQVMLAQKDEEFKKVLNNADLAICDGIGLVWATKFLKGARNLLLESSPRDTEQKRHGRVTGPIANISSRDSFAPFKLTRLSGTDLMITLCQLAAKKGWKVFLLGGKKGVAEKAAKKLDLRFKIKGLRYDDGALDIARETGEEKREIIKTINEFSPQLLFVAYGAPHQEKWIAHNLPQLKVNVAMGVGGAFDYLAGRVSRAPKWVRNIGLEWLWRLTRQPWRVKRQLALGKFMWLVLRSSATGQLR